MREILLGSARLFADETTMPVLDPGRGQTKKGFAWAIARDDRPWGGAEPPAVVFHYAPGRGAEQPEALLGGYAGILQCDGYAAYKSVCAAASGGTTLAFCWSHVRREFFDLAKGKTGADRRGGAAAHRRALRHRGARSAASRRTCGGPPGRRGASRWSRTCSPGSRRSWRACRAAARPRRRSATR